MSRHSTTNPPAVGNDALLHAAAEEFHVLGRSLDAAGHRAIGLHLHRAASALDLALPRQSGWWDNAFNSQEGRSNLFLQIIEALRPVAVIETGTFRGSTTAFIASRFVGRIFTCETDPRWYLTAKATLAEFPGVDVRNQDSRAFLRDIFSTLKEDPLFYYLDAHWEDDLPLAGELDLILSQCRPAVIMIDDFSVPSDPEYTFDDYGPGKSLSLELLATVDPRGASLFFPTLPARMETGARRGCALIGLGDAAAMLAKIADLQPHPWPQEASGRGAADSSPPRPPDLAPLQRLVSVNELLAELDEAGRRWKAAEAERDEAGRNWKAALAERDEAGRMWKVVAAERDEAGRRWKLAEAERDEADRRWKAAEAELNAATQRAAAKAADGREI